MILFLISFCLIFELDLKCHVEGALCPDSFIYYPYEPFITSHLNESHLHGPIWNILRQTYETCCPINNFKNKPLKAIKVPDEKALYNKIMNSYRYEIINSMAFPNPNLYTQNTTGMFGILENSEEENIPGDSFKVQVLYSPGFYLLSKKGMNGLPTIRPVLIDICLQAWPLFVIILMVQGYSAIIFWLLDKILKTNLFPQEFIQGFWYGIWWLSGILFNSNSLTTRPYLKMWIIKLFILIWLIISLLTIIVFISVFTTSFTIHGIKGDPVENKLVGINRHSSDKNWLKLENAVIYEYEAMNNLFEDLDRMKLDLVLIDQVYAKFYAKSIAQKFRVIRYVKRKVTFNVVLRGFKIQNFNCFKSLITIVSQNWLNNFINFNSFKIKNTTNYFNLTDELLFPRLNTLLIFFASLLIVIVVLGIIWQIFFMKNTESFYSYVFKSGGFNTFFKDNSKKTDESIMNFYDRALIKARDEVMQRQQQSVKSENCSSFKNDSRDYSSARIKNIRLRRWHSFSHSRASHWSISSFKKSNTQTFSETIYSLKKQRIKRRAISCSTKSKEDSFYVNDFLSVKL